MEIQKLEQRKGNERGPNLRLGFCIRFSAREEKQELVESALYNVLPIVEKEIGTIAWFAFRVNENDFGALDVFYNEEARDEHWETGSKGIEKMTQSLINTHVDVGRLSIITGLLGEKSGLKLQGTNGALVRFVAKENTREALERALRGLLPTVETTSEVAAWFAFRINQDEYGLFWAFTEEAGQSLKSGNSADTLNKIADFVMPDSYIYSEIKIITAKL